MVYHHPVYSYSLLILLLSRLPLFFLLFILFVAIVLVINRYVVLFSNLALALAGGSHLNFGSCMFFTINHTHLAVVLTYISFIACLGGYIPSYRSRTLLFCHHNTQRDHTQCLQSGCGNANCSRLCREHKKKSIF